MACIRTRQVKWRNCVYDV